MLRRLFSISFFALVFASCSTEIFQPAQELPDETVAPEATGISIRDGHVWAPWEIGRLSTEPQLLEAEAAFEHGNPSQADSIYRGLETSGTELIAEEAFLQRMSLLLKQGRSRDLLAEASTHLQRKGQTIDDAPARLALMVGYGYQYSGELDQALAWLSLANRKSGRAGELSVRITNSTAELIRSVPDEEFENVASRWTTDQFVTALFGGERLRRASGGKPLTRDINAWFSPATYQQGVQSSAQVIGANIPVPVPSSPESATLTVGVLLPFTGEFAEVGEQVKHGIMLGSQNAGTAKFIYGDTAGNPSTAVSEYDRLVKEGAQIFLGPILLKTTEAVAQRSQQVGAPFISFTKRSGIPDLGQTVFRLGVTTDDQVAALIKVAHERRGANSFAILTPRNEGGLEYLESFQKKLKDQGLTLSGSAEYTPGDRQSIELAIARIADKPAQAVFVPDSLENASTVFELLEASPLTSAVLLGPAAWNDAAALRAYSMLLEGALVATPFWSDSPDPDAQSFIAAYKQQFNREPEVLSAQSFDATRLIFQALTQPPFSATHIIEVLSAADRPIKGITGTLHVEPNGEIAREMEVLQVQGGRLQQLSSPLGSTSPTAGQQELR